MVEIPMDPESNWDICPVCLVWLHSFDQRDGFPGVEIMRAHHKAHKGPGVLEATYDDGPKGDDAGPRALVVGNHPKREQGNVAMDADDPRWGVS